MVASRRAMAVGVSTVAMLMALAVTVWSCTLPVGQTNGTGGAVAGAGDETGLVIAEGEVSHGLEEVSRCGDGDGNLDPECGYSLGVVNPADLTEGPDAADPGAPKVGVHSPTCHYETPESHAADSSTGDIAFATVDSNPQEVSQPGARVLTGQGQLPAADDGGQKMDSGPTVMCFYSSDTIGGGSHLNGRTDGAATATMPQPFVVLDQ